ncbi:MAG: hypothetical protein WB992_17265 [Bryobacteraceae bacterium]
MATSAIALLTSLVCTPIATAQAAATQQPAAGQQPAGAAGQQPATTKNWKDRAEYDLYVKITQTTDPKARLDLLNSWQDKYPTTDYNQERLQAFMVTLNQLAGTDPSVRQKLIDKCNEALKLDPKNFTASYFIAVWGPAVGGNSPAPDLATNVETAAHSVLDLADMQFDASKKPANMNDADFTKAKNAVVAVAHNALAWAAITKKDNTTAENEYKASLQANPDQGTISYQYGKLLQEDKSVPDDKKFPTVLFEYARAAQYTGPGPALSPDARTKLMDYYNKAYKDFHGSADGADQLAAQAKTSALPPDNLSITSQAAIANQQADQMNQRIASDPQFKLWYTIKQSLTGDQGDQFFNSNVKDAEIPGGAEGVKNFTGTVISIDPPDHPTKVTLGVEDPTKADATLEFSQPLPSSALEKVKIGSKLDFSGVADSYTKDPYMLTFKDPTVPGVQTAAPPKKGTSRRRPR